MTPFKILLATFSPAASVMSSAQSSWLSSSGGSALSGLWSQRSVLSNSHPKMITNILLKVVCILYMRDSLLMTVTTILVHSDKLRTWQLAKMPKCEPRGWGVSRLLGYWTGSTAQKTQ